MATLRLLHVSDIHFGQEREGDVLFHEAVRRGVVEDAKIMRQRLGAAESILIAGDVAFSGKIEEYKKAGLWLDTLAGACGCKPTSVILVPGNHDVDTEMIDTTVSILHRNIHDDHVQSALNNLGEIAKGADGRNVLLTKLTAFREFAASYGCDFISEAKPYCERKKPLGNGRSLLFRCLNTVQVSELNLPKGRLLLGNVQYDTLERTSNVENIMLAHHPLDWLKDQQRASSFLHSRSRVLVFGHEHLGSLQLIRGQDDRERLEIDSGATTSPAGDDYEYTYNWLELSARDQADGVYLLVKVFPRVWRDQATEFVADSTRMNLDSAGGKEFLVKSEQFTAIPEDATKSGTTRHNHPSADKETTMDADPNFATLRLLFWRHLDWRKRLEVLTQLKLLPETPNQPLPQTLENTALQSAVRQGKMEELWDAVMKHVPVEQRPPHPFKRNG